MLKLPRKQYFPKVLSSCWQVLKPQMSASVTHTPSAILYIDPTKDLLEAFLHGSMNKQYPHCCCQTWKSQNFSSPKYLNYVHLSYDYSTHTVIAIIAHNTLLLCPRHQNQNPLFHLFCRNLCQPTFNYLLYQCQKKQKAERSVPFSGKLSHTI